jgi:hypothetical protein
VSEKQDRSEVLSITSRIFIKKHEEEDRVGKEKSQK